VKQLVWNLAILFASGLTTVVANAQPTETKPPRAKIDDLQIDWIIPNGAFVQLKGQTLLTSANPKISILPRRLFEASADVIAADGSLLLPSGAQLYAMIGPKFRICSQEKQPLPYASATDRVCLQDENGDGVLDRYFLRNRGRSFMSTDHMWFAMNGYPPSELSLLKMAEFKEINRIRAKVVPDLWLEFSFSKSDIFVTTNFDYGFKFLGRCQRNSIPNEASGSIEATCLVKDLTARSFNFQSKNKKERSLSIEGPERDIAVRFDVIAKPLWREMGAAYFE
jgi:hypothetical protein